MRRDFSRELKALGKIKNLDIHINSPGGDVFEGQAIYTQIKNHKAHKTVFVDGLAASIASVIAMAGDEIVMPENANMMIHDPSAFAAGTQADMEKMAQALGKVRNSMINVYARKTGLDKEEISDLMLDETWMDAEEAIEKGFATRATDAVEIAAHFDLSPFKNVPTDAKTKFFQVEGELQQQPDDELPIEDELTEIQISPSVSIKGKFKFEKENSIMSKAKDPDNTNTPQGPTPELVDTAAIVAAERERIAKLTAKAHTFGCAVEFISSLITDGVELAEGYERIMDDAEKRKFVSKQTVLDTLENDANPGTGGGTDPQPENKPNLDTMSFEDRCQHEWDHEPNIRAEFGEVSTYKAYMQHTSQCRVLTGKEK